MKKNVLGVAVVAAFVISSCNSGKSTTGNANVHAVEEVSAQDTSTKVPFTTAENYFVKNTYKNEQVENLKITTQEEFDKIFGMAATMGDRGMPTRIDFSKQYVIAVIGTVTNKKTDFTVNDLLQKSKEIVLNYTLATGEELSFSIQPALLLVVDDTYKGELKFEKK
jgi:hypothetical protein